MRLLNTTQAAAFLQKKKNTLEVWRVSGRGPRFAKAGRSVLYDEADLVAWIEAQKRNSTSQAA